MQRRLLVASVLLALLVPVSARGVVLGARVGWAIPMGDLTEGVDLSDQIDGQVPIWIDLGFNIAPQLTLGAYFRFAPNVRDSAAIDACDLVDADCGGYGLGAGGQLAWRFSPTSAGPWLGVFGGFEALSFEQGLRTRGVDQAFRGWEVGAQGGLDFVWGALAIGPYASVSLGRYTVIDQDLTEIGGPVVDIPDASNHTWIQLGLRGAFGF